MTSPANPVRGAVFVVLLPGPTAYFECAVSMQPDSWQPWRTTDPTFHPLFHPRPPASPAS